MPLVRGEEPQCSPEIKAPVAASPEDSRVRGQVRMHGIIAGYRAAAVLAPTLASSGAEIEKVLHRIAHEIAQQVEDHSFGVGQ